MGVVSILLIAGVAVGLVVATRGDDGSVDSPALSGVKTFEDLGRTHVEGSVTYEQNPPVGGNHAGVWQNCAVYGAPIATEMGVHSMEHGAVWITYRRDLGEPDKDTLEEAAIGQPYVLLSPWAGDLPAPVVASAWGRQLRVDSASDARLKAFIRSFQQGPQTPEPDAPCTGGQGAG